MQLNDEVDALSAIGVDPIEVLVVPRVLGLMIALPLLTVIADAMGIAGGAVRAVMTSVGVQNVLTKSLGTANPHNVIKATFDALVQLRDKADVATARGKQVEEL